MGGDGARYLVGAIGGHVDVEVEEFVDPALVFGGGGGLLGEVFELGKVGAASALRGGPRLLRQVRFGPLSTKQVARGVLVSMRMDRTPTTKVVADLYEAHGAELVRFATAVVGPFDAQDVVSATMTRLIGNGALSGAENPVAFLYRAILNEARSHQRSAIRRRLRERRTAEALVTHNPDIRPEVARAVAGLSAQQRARRLRIFL